MSEELEREARRAKNKIKQEFCGEFLVFLGEAMLNPGKITPENFMRTVSGRVSHVRSKMANVDIAAEEGIVVNEKGEAVMMAPVKKEKPIKKVTVTRKDIGDLWDKINEQVNVFTDGLSSDEVMKENINMLLVRFVDDNRL